MEIAAPKNLQLLQVLRAIASLLVVLLHATTNMQETLHISFLSHSFIFGGAGVDIFFVLSGFIITYTSLQSLSQPKKLGKFIQRRFVRIFPTYWFIITAIILMQLVTPAHLRSHFDLGLSKLSEAYFLLPGHTMIDGVSWTLTYELFFYLLFTLAFIVPFKSWIYYFSAGYILLIIILFLVGYDFHAGNNWRQLLFFPLNIEFFMGVLSVKMIELMRDKLSIAFIVAGASLFLISAFCFSRQFFISANDFNRVIMFGIPSLLILAGLVKFELSRMLNIHSVLLLLGEASYSLYLLHLPIIAISVKVLAKLPIHNSLVLQSCMLIIVLLICVVSMYFFKWIEKPSINSLNALFKSRKPVERIKPVL